jgi:hypothetical protein
MQGVSLAELAFPAAESNPLADWVVPETAGASKTTQ